MQFKINLNFLHNHKQPIICESLDPKIFMCCRENTRWCGDFMYHYTNLLRYIKHSISHIGIPEKKRTMQLMAMVWLSFVSETETVPHSQMLVLLFFSKKYTQKLQMNANCVLSIDITVLIANGVSDYPTLLYFAKLCFRINDFLFCFSDVCILLTRYFYYSILLRIDYSNYLFIDIKRCFGFCFCYMLRFYYLNHLHVR